jgi:hypothetical protein
MHVARPGWILNPRADLRWRREDKPHGRRFARWFPVPTGRVRPVTVHYQRRFDPSVCKLRYQPYTVSIMDLAALTGTIDSFAFNNACRLAKIENLHVSQAV